MTNNNKTLVSVCIPTYNHTLYLRKTLDSILIQNFFDYEVIVTDDSTTNEVKDLISGYNFSGRLKYFRNEARLGTPENWNRAILLAKGKYIKLMLHDDWFSDKNSISSFVEVLETHPEYIAAFSNSNNVDLINCTSYLSIPPPFFLKSLNHKEVNIRNLIVKGNFIGAPSAIIFRNENYLFDNNLKYLVDIDFYINLLKNDKKVYYIDAILINIGLMNDRVTTYCANNVETEIFEIIYLMNKINSKNLINNLFYLIYLIKLFSRYNINSLQKTKRYYNNKIPTIVYISIFFNKLLPLKVIKKVFTSL